MTSTEKFHALLAYAKSYAQEKYETLHEKYSSQYIAIVLNKGIIDNDTNKTRLLFRIPEKLEQEKISYNDVMITTLESLVEKKSGGHPVGILTPFIHGD